VDKTPHSEIWTILQTREGCAVLLRPFNTDIVLPIFIGQLESQSILIGKEGFKAPRPLTHDLFLSLLLEQDLIIEHVEICDIIENIFHAKLVICGGKHTADKPLVMDCRPSDALALSVRCKCPIIVSPEIAKQAGISIDLIFDLAAASGSAAGGGKGKTFSRKKKLKNLQEQLDIAVTNEDYERAAVIRDIINKLGNGNE